MQIEFTKQQFKEMLLASMLYHWVYGGLADRNGEDFKKFSKLEEYLLEIAEKENMTKLFERFHGQLISNNKLDIEQTKIIDEYEDDVFWNELTTLFGKRDFFRTITKKEEKELKKRKWMPERIHNIYKKYREEFEKHGIERLKIED